MLRHVYEEIGLNSALLKFGAKNDFPHAEVLAQFHLRDLASKKFPRFLQDNRHWLFPDRQSIEQATPEVVAKACADSFSGNSVLDICGGLGIDFYFLSQRTSRAVYVELNPLRAQFARWNFQHISHVEIFEGDGSEFLKHTKDTFDLIFLDPDRRAKASRTFLLEDSRPNLRELWPLLKLKAKAFWVKISPMEDISAVLFAFPEIPSVEVWAQQREVKTLLMKWGSGGEGALIALHKPPTRPWEIFMAKQDDIHVAAPVSACKAFIFEPNPALMKVGVWKKLAETYDLTQLDQHTHIFTGDIPITDFPGKMWRVTAEGKPNDAELIDPTGMQVICRNYPQKPEVLRKKFKIKESNEKLLLATKVQGERRWIVGIQRTGLD